MSRLQYWILDSGRLSTVPNKCKNHAKTQFFNGFASHDFNFFIGLVSIFRKIVRILGDLCLNCKDHTIVTVLAGLFCCCNWRLFGCPLPLYLFRGSTCPLNKQVPNVGIAFLCCVPKIVSATLLLSLSLSLPLSLHLWLHHKHLWPYITKIYNPCHRLSPKCERP